MMAAPVVVLAGLAFRLALQDQRYFVLVVAVVVLTTRLDRPAQVEMVVAVMVFNNQQQTHKAELQILAEVVEALALQTHIQTVALAVLVSSLFATQYKEELCLILLK
jgi:hypothetical protein